MKKSQLFQSVVIAAIVIVLIFSMTAIGSVAESNDGYKINMGGGENESNKGLLSGDNNNNKNQDKTHDLQNNELTDAVQETNGIQREDAESMGENGGVGEYTNEFGEVSGGASMQKNTETVRTEQLSEKTYESVNQAPVLKSSGDSEYFRNKGISKFTETGMVRSSDSDLKDVTGVNNGGNGGESGASITLKDESSTVPIPQTSKSNTQQTATGVEVTGGANGDEYAFKRASDGTVHVTTKDGEPTSLPAGTELNVQTTEMSDTASTDVTYTSPPDSLNSKAREQTQAIIESENAETNTEKSRAISDWLKENKEYRADSTYESDEEISSFITEKNGGSAEEFAIAHTAMSREAGVPSRVATGYKKPSRESETTRAMDKHAWSETQTESGDWVTVDPTPSERDGELQRVRNGNPSNTTMGLDESVVEQVESTQPTAREVTTGNDTVTDSTVVETGDGSGESQSRRDEPGEESPGDDSQSRETPKQVTASPPYDISVSPDPIPGKRITITVTGDEGTPASGIGVVMNGELVGVADSQGQVQITTPYTTRLEITTKQPDSTGLTGSFAVPQQTSDVAQRVFELPVDVNTTTGVVLPGEQATITAVISDTPVDGAHISINGESVGTANANGELTTTLPSDVSTGDMVDVTVTRGDIRGRDTIQLAEPQLKADGGVAPLPFTEATFTSIKTKNSESKPVTSTEITVHDGDGDVVVSSDVNNDGVVNASIPVTSSVTGSASISGVETTASITGIYYWIGGVGVVLSGVVIVAGRSLYRKRDVVLQYLGKVKEVVLSYNAVLQKIQQELRNIKERVVSLIVTAVEYGVNKKERVITQLRSIGVKAFIKQKIRALFAWLVKNTPVGGSENSDVQFTSQRSTGNEQERGGRSKTAETIIREYWGRVVRFTIRRASQTSKTTVEIKNKAVNMGLPEKHTTRIQRAFTDIEYGKKTGESRLNDASESAEQLQNTSEINIKD